MVNSKDTETANKAIDTAQKIAVKLDKMSKAATALAKEGKALGKLDEMLQNVAYFGQAATVLGAVGGGLGLVTLILGTKSAAEQNTELLTAIKGQISQLSTDMTRLFEKAEKTAHLIAAQARWDTKFDELSDYHSRYDHFLASKDYDAYRQHLLKLNQEDLMHLADTFGELMNDDLLAQENLLLATYKSSFGNEPLILSIGTHILQETYFLQELCLLIGETIRSTEPGRIHELLPDAEVSARFAIAINKIAEAIRIWAKKCRDECWTNVEEFLETQQFPDTHLDWQGYYVANLAAIGESLRTRWPRYDWSVIVYDAVGGYDRHGVVSSENGIYRKAYFRRDCGSGQANIIVAAVPAEAHNFDPGNATDLGNAWYDLTLDSRATMIPKNALAGFHTRKRDGLFFYCLKEGQDNGVRMNYWSRAAQYPGHDTRTTISIYNQGAWQEGRIISSEINLASIDGSGRHYNTSVYYQTIHLTA